MLGLQVVSARVQGLVREQERVGRSDRAKGGLRKQKQQAQEKEQGHTRGRGWGLVVAAAAAEEADQTRAATRGMHSPVAQSAKST